LIVFGGAGLVAIAWGLTSLAVLIGGDAESVGLAVAVVWLARLAWWGVTENKILQ
jgi:hypothetical protein